MLTSPETQRDTDKVVDSLTRVETVEKERRHVGWWLNCSRRKSSTLLPLNVHFLFVLTGPAQLGASYNGGSNGGQLPKEMAAIVAFKFFSKFFLLSLTDVWRCFKCTRGASVSKMVTMSTGNAKNSFEKGTLPDTRQYRTRNVGFGAKGSRSLLTAPSDHSARPAGCPQEEKKYSRDKSHQPSLDSGLLLWKLVYK